MFSKILSFFKKRPSKKKFTSKDMKDSLKIKNLCIAILYAGGITYGELIPLLQFDVKKTYKKKKVYDCIRRLEDKGIIYNATLAMEDSLRRSVRKSDKYVLSMDAEYKLRNIDIQLPGATYSSSPKINQNMYKLLK